MQEKKIEKIPISIIEWIGSIRSLIIHSILFILSFSLYFLNVDLSNILLFLTTIVSLEAIYLSIFIQMSVNLQSKKLQNVAQEVEDIQENMVDIQENVEDIQENVEEIQENVGDIQKEDEDDSDKILERIENAMNLLTKEVMELKKQKKSGN